MQHVLNLLDLLHVSRPARLFMHRRFKAFHQHQWLTAHVKLSTFTRIFACETQDNCGQLNPNSKEASALVQRIRTGGFAIWLLTSACSFFHIFTTVSLAEFQTNTLLLGILSTDILPPIIDYTKHRLGTQTSQNIVYSCLENLEDQIWRVGEMRMTVNPWYHQVD